MLADAIGQRPNVISDMCHGKRLTGPQARERVLDITRLSSSALRRLLTRA